MIVGATLRAVRTQFPRSPDGIIDELEIFDYALTPGQIQAIYDTEGACKVAPEPYPDVDIDIKPGSDDNPINLGGKSAKSEKSAKSGEERQSGKSGKSAKSKKSKKSKRSGKGNANIPVAILTTDDSDASKVDVSTVTLGDDDDTVGVIVKKNDTLQAALEDVDDDGDLDLLMHFSIADLVDSGDLDESTTQLCVNGLTLEGDAIHGCDSVTIVGKGDDD